MKRFPELTSFSLHILAMVFMLCDHLWATIIPGSAWLTWLGRLAYPIFAFMIAEGYARTRDVKRYMKRLLLLAVLSEIPFNLMYGGGVIYPFQQNVIWTFLIALVLLRWIDRVRRKGKVLGISILALGICIFAFMVEWISIPALSAILAVMGGCWWRDRKEDQQRLLAASVILTACGAGFLVGRLTMVDYGECGVLTVLLFALLRGDAWWNRLGQLAGMVVLNTVVITGLSVPVTLFGMTFDVYQQSLAILALIPIWLYRGRQGPHSRGIRLAFYAFYPVHILILGLLVMFQ